MKYIVSLLLIVSFIGASVLGALIMEYSMQNHSGCATATFTGGTCYTTITFSQDIALGLLSPLFFVVIIYFLSFMPALPTLSPVRKRIRADVKAPDDSFLRWLSLFEHSPSSI